MERRMVLAGAAASATALLPGATSAANTTAASPVSPDLAAALARFRASIPAHFDRTYVENAVVPFFLTSIYEGERPALPMIDVTLTKENALPHDLWGLIYQDWKPTPEEGVTVFLQGWRSVVTTIFASGSTCPLSHPTFTGQCMEPRPSRSLTGCLTRNLQASPSCGIISTTTGIFIGICTSG